MTGRRWWGWGGGFLVGVALAQIPGKATGAELLFQAEAQTLSGTCAAQPVRLEGNHNVVTLSGACASLLVKGVANTINLTIAPHGVIHVEGSENQVHYVVAGAPPVIEVLGPNNDVVAGEAAHPISVEPPQHSAPPSPSQETTPAPASLPPVPQRPATPTPAAASARPNPPPAASAKKQVGPLELSGDDQQRLADCEGRDVIVTGNRSAYVIRGQCHSLVVRGDLLTVQAIMRAAAQISVTGRGSVVSWAIGGKGHAPSSVVRGVGSRVQRAVSIGGQPAL